MTVVFITCILAITSADVLVNTNNGPVRGVSSLAEDIEAFLGIPYAEPPVGELRFSKPIPKKKWNDVYNATNMPPPCTQFSFEHQYHFAPDTSEMSEDCLYLNIWAPKAITDDGLKPVIIFIHPGAFVTGSSNLKAHDGSRLASHGDMIVVTINYRLGAFGYFLAFIEEADGNMGMFDQIMAMKWVKENSRNFGGDPDNIILMGASAGAYSISMHMISPLSKDLFKRAILHSGSAINSLLMDNNSMLFENSKVVANLVGCTNETLTLENDPKSVVKCLKHQPKEAFVKAETTVFETRPVVFFPRVNDAFLPKSSIADFFREGKFRKDLEVVMGFTKEEGTILLMSALPHYFGNYGQTYTGNVNKIRAITISKAFLSSLRQTNTSEVTSFYQNFVRNRTSREYTKMLANIIGDFSIACGTMFLADFLSLKNQVYFYKFEYPSASTPMADWIGTTHLDDLQYVFGNPYYDNFTLEEIELSHRLMDRWSAFARTGTPSIPGEIPWFQYSYENPLYLNIGEDGESIRMKPNDHCEIWRKRFNSQFDPQLIEFLMNAEEDTMDVEDIEIEGVN